MLFNSFPYILIFLPAVALACYVLQRLRLPIAAQATVLAASIYFYGRSSPFNLVYLAASLLANWLIARWIERADDPAKKRVLVSGLVLNIAYLCVFKYLAFFASIVSFLLPRGYVLPALPFPLGISFFTVAQIMYLVDCYEGDVSAGTLFDHATFVSFFPYVISGPISKAKRIRHQFGRFGGVDGSRAQAVSRGIFQFSMGMFKKAVLADSFARVSVFGYNSAKNLSAAEAWIFSIAYTFQLYFDFSGYSDMAIGSGLMLGIEIPRNFDAPFKSTSISEFWTRWHITLSDFITTYIYTPILLSFQSATLASSAVATLIAMGIAGLWHGPAWTFVIFGLIYGVALVLNQYWRRNRKKLPVIPPFLCWLMTFTTVLIAQIYFGASSVPQATERVLGLFNFHRAFSVNNLGEMSVEGISLKIFGLPLLIGTIAAFFGPSSDQLAREFRPTPLNCFYVVALTVTALVFINSNIPVPFIYFRF